MSDRHGSEFERLLAGYLDNGLQQDALRRLCRFLQDDPDCRRRFASEVRLHTALRDVLVEGGAHAAVPTRESKSTTAEVRRKRSRVTWGRRLSVAACLAIIAGALAYNHWRSTRFSDVLIARIRETAPGVVILRDGTRVVAMMNMPLRAGDRIRTAANQRMTFTYGKEATRIDVKERTDLEIGGVERGPRLRLDRGVIDATVAPQGEGRQMVVETPQAKATVEGTVFSMAVDDRRSRLEVREGLVALMRLSDMKTIDVAAGQYAVAAEGMELAALPVPARSAPVPGRPGAVSGGPEPTILSEAECPAPRTHLDGTLLFEDTFDGPTDNWEFVVGNPYTDFRPAGGDPAYYRMFWKGSTGQTKIFNIDDPMPDEGTTTSLMVLNLHGREKPEDRELFVGMRSVRPVQARRFVVEARLSFQDNGASWFPAVESVASQKHILTRSKKSGHFPARQFCPFRWECETGTGDAGTIVRSFFRGEFLESYRITSGSTKLLLASARMRLCMDHLTVRELKDEPAGAGER